jgi:hypothetical protein
MTVNENERLIDTYTERLKQARLDSKYYFDKAERILNICGDCNDSRLCAKDAATQREYARTLELRIYELQLEEYGRTFVITD